MKHIKWDFCFECMGPSPWGGLRGWGRGQNLSFTKYGHVVYQIEADNVCSNMLANFLPTDTLLTQGVESNHKFL